MRRCARNLQTRVGQTGRVGGVGWLADASEESLRTALGAVIPELAGLPLTLQPREPQSNPLYWSASAVIGDAFVVKYAWSEVRAVRLWREGVVVDRLHACDASLPIPELVTVSREPALVVTRLVAGEPLSWEWAGRMTCVGDRAGRAGSRAVPGPTPRRGTRGVDRRSPGCPPDAAGETPDACARTSSHWWMNVAAPWSCGGVTGSMTC